jgi:hypothetical protein
VEFREWGVETSAMTRAVFTVAIALLYSAAAATPPPVTVVSPCECRDAHGKARLTFSSQYVRLNSHAGGTPSRCTGTTHCAIRDVEFELAAMKAEHDPLASHIFVSRRSYRNVNDTKSGKRREMMARLSFNTACELGFRGSLDEWERLMGAVARR